MSEWEDINVPRGAFIGWGMRPGQYVQGEVIEYGADTGTDYNQKECPQLSVILTAPAASFNKALERTNHDPNSLVVLNCGLVSLARAVKAANLNQGDEVRIELTDIIKGAGKNGGDVKEFGIKVRRGNGTLSTNAQRAMASAQASAASDAGFGNNDPGGFDAPSGAATGTGSFADDEPPF